MNKLQKGLKKGVGEGKEPREEGFKEVDASEYELIDFIGHGACSHVHSALKVQPKKRGRRFPTLKKRSGESHPQYDTVSYAIKVFETDDAEVNAVIEVAKNADPTTVSADIRARMPGVSTMEEIHQEVSILKSLQSSEHVVALYETFTLTSATQVFMVMELLEVSLEKLADLKFFERRRDAMRPILGQILKGLCFLKSQSVLHGDIKTPNVMLSYSSQVKLVDFGFSQRIQGSKKLVVNERTSGTESYMAPELFIDRQEYDYAADIWAFGVVAHTMYSSTERFPEGFNDDCWSLWEQSNDLYFIEVIGARFGTLEAKRSYDSLLIEGYVPPLSEEEKEELGKKFEEDNLEKEGEFKDVRRQHADFIELLRMCLVPIPMRGPASNITRDDVYERATVEELMSLEYFNISDRDSLEIIQSLLTEYRAFDGQAE